jgi:hypothetical protein
VVRPQPRLSQASTLLTLTDSFFSPNHNTLACQRLIKRAFEPFELSSLIKAVFLDKDQFAMVNGLRGEEAQAFIDVTYEVCSPFVRHREVRLFDIDDIYSVD